MHGLDESDAPGGLVCVSMHDYTIVQRPQKFHALLPGHPSTPSLYSQMLSPYP